MSKTCKKKNFQLVASWGSKLKKLVLQLLGYVLKFRFCFSFFIFIFIHNTFHGSVHVSSTWRMKTRKKNLTFKTIASKVITFTKIWQARQIVNFAILGNVHTNAGEIWKGCYISRLGLPSTLIRHGNGAFWKRSSNRTNLKTPALRFPVDRKNFENVAFRKRWHIWCVFRVGLPFPLA